MPDLLPCKWHMDEDEWYATTLAHWTNEVSADGNDGVLGGWAEVDEEDARGSLEFIQDCIGTPPELWPISGLRALDCGAGVGRVTGSVLIRVAERVHLVEVSQSLLSKASKELAEHSSRLELEQCSLREFAPPPGSYDLVWAQWVLGHLTDTDFVGLLNRCRKALRPGGAVVIKDNAATPSQCDQGSGRYLLDEENAAVIRSHAHVRALCKLAGLKLLKSKVQENFPEDLHIVRMYWFGDAGADIGVS